MKQNGFCNFMKYFSIFLMDITARESINQMNEFGRVILLDFFCFINVHPHGHIWLIYFANP